MGRFRASTSFPEASDGVAAMMPVVMMPVMIVHWRDFSRGGVTGGRGLMGAAYVAPQTATDIKAQSKSQGVSLVVLLCVSAR
jgi:hypothetical protein